MMKYLGSVLDRVVHFIPRAEEGLVPITEDDYDEMTRFWRPCGQWSKEIYGGDIDIHCEHKYMMMGADQDLVEMEDPESCEHNKDSEQKPELIIAVVQRPGEDVAHHGVVVFRGTDVTDGDDVIADLRLTFAEALPLAGGGAREEVEEMCQRYVGRIAHVIADNHLTSLTVTGHSLGAFRAGLIGTDPILLQALQANLPGSTISTVLRDHVHIVCFDPPGWGLSSNYYEMPKDYQDAVQHSTRAVSKSLTAVSRAGRQVVPLMAFDSTILFVNAASHSIDGILAEMDQRIAIYAASIKERSSVPAFDYMSAALPGAYIDPRVRDQAPKSMGGGFCGFAAFM